MTFSGSWKCLKILFKSYAKVFWEILILAFIYLGAALIIWGVFRLFGSRVSISKVVSWYALLICLMYIMRWIYKFTPLEKDN